MGQSLEPFSIIAFDPGGTTGIAMVDCYQKIDDMTAWNFRTSELGPNEHHYGLWDFLAFWHERTNHKKYLVTESFEFRQNLDKRKVDLISKEYIGILKLFAKINDMPYTEQSASTAKAFVSDDKLIKLGILEKPIYQSRHRNDALRHLIRFMVINLKIRHPITTAWKDGE